MHFHHSNNSISWSHFLELFINWIDKRFVSKHNYLFTFWMTSVLNWGQAKVMHLTNTFITIWREKNEIVLCLLNQHQHKNNFNFHHIWFYVEFFVFTDVCKTWFKSHLVIELNIWIVEHIVVNSKNTFVFGMFRKNAVDEETSMCSLFVLCDKFENNSYTLFSFCVWMSSGLHIDTLVCLYTSTKLNFSNWFSFYFGYDYTCMRCESWLVSFFKYCLNTIIRLIQSQEKYKFMPNA